MRKEYGTTAVGVRSRASWMRRSAKTRFRRCRLRTPRYCKPADSIEPMPGDSIEPMPGDSIEPMPGSDLACKLTLQADAANCSVAINTTIPPLSDAGAPANLLRGLHPADTASRVRFAGGKPGRHRRHRRCVRRSACRGRLSGLPFSVRIARVHHVERLLPQSQSKRRQRVLSRARRGVVHGNSLGSRHGFRCIAQSAKFCSSKPSRIRTEDLGAAVDTAASLGALAISNSYYGPEWPGETAVDAHYDHPGIALTVSAGVQSKTVAGAMAKKLAEPRGSHRFARSAIDIRSRQALANHRVTGIIRRRDVFPAAGAVVRSPAPW